MLLWSIAKFELSKGLKRLSTYIYFGIFFAIGCFLCLVGGGAFQSISMAMGTGGKVLINSPFSLSRFIGVTSFFGVLIISGIMGQAVYQDFLHDSYAFFFTAPIRKWHYLCGRFLGAFLLLIAIFSSIALGFWCGSLMPFLDQNVIGPNRLAAYLQPYLIIVIPNVLVLGALFFSMAALGRKMLPVYVTSVVLLVGYLIATGLTQKIENKTLAAMLDPFGRQASSRATEYWSVAEQNSRLMPIDGVTLQNRLLWLGIAASLFGWMLFRFRFAQGSESQSSRVVERSKVDETAIVSVPVTAPDFTTSNRPTPVYPWRHIPRLTWLAFKETVKNIYFVVIVLAGVMFMAFASQSVGGSLYGTETYPVTGQVLELASGSFALFMLIVITFYSGELVWRERDARIDQICDVLPLPTWLPLIAKLLALMLVQVLLLTVVMLTGMLIQVSQGYVRFELGLYLQDLFGIKLVAYALLCVLAIAVQVLVNHKYSGHFVMVLYYMFTIFASQFGFEHNLYHYGSDSGYTYSDMNGFGHFLYGIAWFNLYWAVCAVLLAIATNLLWVRGLESSGQGRMAVARSRITPRLRLVAATTALAFFALGVFVYYNTNILNKFRTSYEIQSETAEYERLYKSHEKEPQPRVTDCKVAFDLFPRTRSVRAKGTYQLQNKTDQPISTVYVNVPDELTIHELAIGTTPEPTKSDRRLGFHTFQLQEPLAPTATSELRFDVEYISRGFRNTTNDTDIVYNGTFLNSGYLPHLGYQDRRELVEDRDRRKQKLAPKARMPDLEDAEARKNNYIANDGDWVTLDATVSTDPDQIAIVPGYLQREWTENGRRYFHYRTEGKILFFFSVLSARYEVLRDSWKDVAIEIYYQRGHEYNLDKMVRSIKSSLDYFTTNFSPYQHRQVRIIEFPGYATFAQSFPNTIPYSESIGFIARVDPDNPDDIDYPFYVTAHEVAHQWWAHQVIGGNVQGATMMSETFAQYSALMVMKQTMGADKMRRFLRYELDRYLMGRGLERKKELPLARNENQQYIHYNKGSLVMYALQDYIGEQAVNRALANYIRAVGYQEPPYTNSLEFLGFLRRETPAELQYLITDLFETITLFENRAVVAKYRQLDDGSYEVQITITAKKFRADELGEQSEIELTDMIDVGVFTEDQQKNEKVLYLEKHRLHSGEQVVTVRVPSLPKKAGVDPFNKLIDRNPADNSIRVTGN